MSEVLYRKYRPISFSQVEGQESLVQILKESILQGKTSHAYLFCGPRGCGKTTMARIMAKAVNCKNFALNSDVCNECEACIAINNGSMDVLEMDAASNRGIEEIRIVRDTVNFVPNFLNKKVYIIDEAHMLTKEAFNALLKTLEEPPEHVIFILATTESHKLPVTILSRVTRFDFKLGSENDVLKKLGRIIVEEGYKLSEASLKLIFEYSGGSFRDSESLLSKVILTSSTKDIDDVLVNKALGVSDLKKVNEFIDGFLSKNVSRLLEIVKEISESNDNIPIFLDQIIQFANQKLTDQAKEGSISVEYMELANLAIKIKSDIRDFSDKAIIVSLCVLNHFNRALFAKTETVNLVPTVLPQKTMQATEVVKESNPVVPTAAIPAVTQKALITENMDYITAVGLRAQTVLPRLKGMINTSKIEIVNDEIRVISPYKFNLAYMSKKEARDIFLDVANEIYKKPMGIAFSLSSEPIQSEEVKNEEEKSNIDDKIISKAKPDKSIDNSNLVEGIF